MKRLRWPAVMVGLYCLGMVGVGVFGLLERPAPALLDVLGPSWGTWGYSVLLIILGLLGAAGVARSPKATVWALYAMAFTTGLHGLALMLNGGVQTGLRLFIAPLMMIPCAWCWRRWAALRWHVKGLADPSAKRCRR